MYGWGVAPSCSNWLFAVTNPAQCFVDSAVIAAKADYNYWFGKPQPKVLATAGVPAGALDPEQYYATPESGEAAQATVDELLNQQLRDQQAINAGQVRSTWTDEFLGGAAVVGDAAGAAAEKGLTFGVSGLVWVAVGLGVFGLVALSAGGPRRYGR